MKKQRKRSPGFRRGDVFYVNLTLPEELRPMILERAIADQREPRDWLRMTIQQALGWKPKPEFFDVTNQEAANG